MRYGYPLSRLFCLLCALALAGCQSSEEKVDSYLDSAEKLIDSKELEKAQIQIRNALKIDDQNARAYLLLADTYEVQSKFQQMYGALTKASEIDDKSAAAFRGLAKLLLMGGDLDKSRENLDKALAIEPQDAEGRLLDALILARQGKSDEAYAMVTELYAAHPDNLEIVVSLTGMLVQRDDTVRALEVIEQSVPRFPDADTLRMIQFRILAGRDQQAEATAVLREIIAGKPDNLEYRKMLALYLARSGDMAGAETSLRESVAANPGSVDAKLLLASFLGQQDRQSAVDVLKGFVQQTPDAPKLKFALAETYVREGALGEASKVYEEIVGGEFSNEDVLGAKNELARIALRQNNSVEARRIVEDILTADSQNPEALLARAVVSLGERKTDDAIADLRIVVRDRPQSDRAHLLLARAYLQNSAAELAEQSLHDALEINPLNDDAALLYARGRMSKQDFKGALDTLDRLLAGGVSNEAAEGLRIQVRLMQKDWKAATDLASGVARTTGNPAYERYVLALTLFGQERYAESIGMFQSVLAENPKMEGALGGIARAWRASGQPEKGIDFLKEKVKADPASLLAKGLLADEQVRSNDREGAISTYREAIAAHPALPQPYLKLSSLLTSAGRLEEADVVLGEGIAACESKYDLQLQRAMLYETRGKKQEAMDAYRSLLEALPTLDVAANNLAVLVAGDGKDPAKLEEAAAIARRFESATLPWFADTLGWIYYQQMNYAKAADLLTRAAKGAPGEPLFQYHAGAAMYELKDFSAARKYLQEAEKLVSGGKAYPEHAEAMALLAKIPPQ